MRPFALLLSIAVCLVPVSLSCQQPIAWGDSLAFHTFSIAAVDTATGETGVAVTTRVVCVGNAVPWVRAGVGAVATQANTRMEYGHELLDLLATGMAAREALVKVVAADTGRLRRQVGVVGLKGGSAQFTGDSTRPWSGHRAGPGYVTQGNLLVGAEVIEAVARSFERSAGSGRYLADRLVEALAAGQAAGGDARKGRAQSAAVLVADPRPGRALRPDRVTVDLNVCEHSEPVAELRRQYDAVSQTLGFRTLQQFTGNDVWQLKEILHALGHFQAGADSLIPGPDALRYSTELADAVDGFRAAEGLSTPANGSSPPGLIDQDTVARLWAALERTGQAREIRQRLKRWTEIRR